jgi:hypothetical protein
MRKDHNIYMYIFKINYDALYHPIKVELKIEIISEKQ